LLENEYRFKELFNNMSSGVAIYSAIENGLDFTLIDFNKAAEKIEQIGKEEIIGKPVTEIFPGIRDFGLLDVFQRVYKTGQSEHHPVSVYKDDRICGWRENYVYRLPSAEIVAIYQDVTEQKIAEEALRISEDKYRGIFMNSLDTIFVANCEEKIVNINSAGIKLFGYSLKEIRKINVGDLYADRDEREKCQKEINKNGFVRNCEVKLKRRDGQILSCIISASAHINDRGETTGYHGIIHDITELKILGGLLPICSHCKKIRDDQGYWNQLEQYVTQFSRASFSHSICPDCLHKYYSEV
jgi:PAS domain S-box-containing protein